MIISHQHKFIFIKTRRTASCSFEFLMSKHLGPEDICTGRKGETPCMNISPDANAYMTAKEISEAYPEEWKNYYKFTIERNPWTKVGSYYCANREEGQTFDEFVLEGNDFPTDWESYTDDNRIIVNQIYMMENMRAMYRHISEHLNITIPKTEWFTVKQNSGTKCVINYKELYSDKTIDKVANLFYNEMRTMGYVYD